MAISPDGTWLATASADSTVRTWQVVSRAAAALIRAENRIFGCAWSPDGSAIAAGGQGGLYLFRFSPGQSD